VTRLSEFIAALKEKLSTEKEFDPWDKPDTPQKKITEEDIEKAVKTMKRPTRKPHRLTLMTTQLFMLVWGLAHFGLLYVMIGSPISGGILVYVIVNMGIFSHYFILLRKVNQNE